MSTSRRLALGTGLDAHVLEWGADSRADHTVVLVHGFLDSAWAWEDVAAPLVAAGLHVIAPAVHVVDPRSQAPRRPVEHASPPPGSPSSMAPSQLLSTLSQTSGPAGTQTHARVAGSHVGFNPGQSASLRHSTHAFGFAAVSQSGVARPHCVLSAHASIAISVGGLPGAGPLPSVE